MTLLKRLIKFLNPKSEERPKWMHPEEWIHVRAVKRKRERSQIKTS